MNIPIINRFFESGNDFKSGRLDNWEYAFNIIEKSPLMGTGAGNLNLTLSQMHYSFSESGRVTAHNGHLESVFITVLATGGVIGLTIFLIWLVLITNKMFALMRTTQGSYHNYITAFLYGWFVMLVNMITDPAFIFDFRITFLFLAVASLPYVIETLLAKMPLKTTLT